MSDFLSELDQRLESLRQQGLHRRLRHVESPQGVRLRVDGSDLLNFSSNDYLGLANEPALKAAAIQAVERYGAGAGASRLICGSLMPHEELDSALARFKGTEAALSFSSGYAAALGTICALAAKEDVIILDKLVHASIIDGARLSGAKLRVFRHNDAEDLGRILSWANRRAPASAGRRKARILIVTESVFSMDGDHAPLREIVELKDQHGAWLMVDEAHATGLYGPTRRGLAEELHVADRIEIQMGTLGKAFGAAGGYICGPRPLIEYLVNRARSFIFSTAPVPAAAAAALAGVQFVQSALGEARRAALWERIAQFCKAFDPKGARGSAIIPLIIGDEERALEASRALKDAGVFVPAVRYPSVPRGSARLRLTLTAAHSRDHVRQLIAALQFANLTACA